MNDNHFLYKTIVLYWLSDKGIKVFDFRLFKTRKYLSMPSSAKNCSPPYSHKQLRRQTVTTIGKINPPTFSIAGISDRYSQTIAPNTRFYLWELPCQRNAELSILSIVLSLNLPTLHVSIYLSIYLSICMLETSSRIPLSLVRYTTQ